VGAPSTSALVAEEPRRDELTALADRRSLCDALDRLAGRPLLSAVAVVALGLDHFGRVNEGYGQSTGDAVLRRVAERLAAEVPEDGLHLLARVGGDTFALVTDGVDDLPAAHFVADRLASVAAAAVDEFSLDLHPTASTGIVLGTSAHGSNLLSHAETALREARRSGGHRSTVFDHPLKGRVLSRSHLEAALRVAIEEEQLRLHYQPIVEVGTGYVRGFEALVRWLHPDDGLLGPDRFIGAAEETGLIRPLGAWVLRTAVRQLDELHRAHPELGLEMSVNVSARQLDDPTMLDTLVEALSHLTAAPSQLCLEITESALLGDAEQAAATLRTARSLGVRVALDDFGTGYSSLSQIRTIAIDVLKIDQSFVAGLTTCPEDALVVDAMVHLGTHLGYAVVAEGVETEDQCRRLQAMGCRLTQGFLWSRPVPGDVLEEILESSAQGAYRLAPVGDATVHTGGPAVHESAGELTSGARPPEVAPSDTAQSATELHDALVVLSHELRTPIHVIRGFAQLLADDLDGEDDSRRSALQAIGRQAEVMTGMVESLVDARAIDTGTLRIAHDPVDLSALVRQVCDDLCHTLGDHPLRVVSPVEAAVIGDAGRLRQVVTNLVVNAAKFAPAATPIEVLVTRSGPLVTVNVRDRGPGVPPDQVGALFRKFSRLGSTRPGTGLGLYLARGLARAHGGDLRYRDTLGGGADFELTVPAAG
jgi:diguanylate cyclase (GGDEF)-like protein